MDTIGCISAPNDFVAVGTGTEYLLGVCEGYFISHCAKLHPIRSTSYCDKRETHAVPSYRIDQNDDLQLEFLCFNPS